MFGDKKNKIKDSERSLISETVSIEGTINSSGAIDVAGLVKGPVISKELIVRDTGSITGTIEADDVEIHGHLDGKVSAQNIVIGATGTVKGDIEFGVNLRTENGADIDGYIKKTNNLLLFYKDIDSEGNISVWPSNKKKWTNKPKLGWMDEAMNFFDDMISKEDKDRGDYDRQMRRGGDDTQEQVDVYNYVGKDEVEDECIVDADDVIDV